MPKLVCITGKDKERRENFAQNLVANYYSKKINSILYGQYMINRIARFCGKNPEVDSEEEIEKTEKVYDEIKHWISVGLVEEEHHNIILSCATVSDIKAPLGEYWNDMSCKIEVDALGIIVDGVRINNCDITPELTALINDKPEYISGSKQR